MLAPASDWGRRGSFASGAGWPDQGPPRRVRGFSQSIQERRLWRSGRLLAGRSEGCGAFGAAGGKGPRPRRHRRHRSKLALRAGSSATPSAMRLPKLVGLLTPGGIVPKLLPASIADPRALPPPRLPDIWRSRARYAPLGTAEPKIRPVLGPSPFFFSRRWLC